MTVLPRLQADLDHADRRFLHRRRRRRRVARGSVVAVLAVAAVLTPLVSIAAKDPRHTPGLLQLAAAKAAQVPASSFGPFEVRGANAVMSIGDKRPFTILVPYTKSMAPTGDGAYEQRSADGIPQFAGPESEANFLSASHTTSRAHAIRSLVFPPSTQRVGARFYLGAYGEHRRIPTIDELHRELRDLERRSVWSGPARTGPGPSLAPNGKPSGLDLVMPYVLALLAGPTVPTTVRAEVFHALESTRGVRVLQNAHDHEGRAGIGIVRDFDDNQGVVKRTTIVYDPNTTRILGSQTQILKNDRREQSNPGLHPGAVIAYATYRYGH